MNINSPENLLSPWIQANHRSYLELGDGNKTRFGNILLANLLRFAVEKNVGIEMYDWLESPVGQKFFKSRDAKPVGSHILSSLRWLDDSYIDFGIDDYEQMVFSALSQFINDNYEEIRFPLMLK